jgi:hypothetical protein
MGCILAGLVLVSSGLADGPAAAAAQGLPARDGSLLPFLYPVSGSKAARTMQASTYSPLPAPQRLPRGAPKVLIIMLDEAGTALASTFGGDIRTPTPDRLATSRVSFNRFQTTAMCTPTRCALLSGRTLRLLVEGDGEPLGQGFQDCMRKGARICVLGVVPFNPVTAAIRRA